MGQITDQKIRDFQERSGIEPATGKRAERLADMSKCAHELIQVLALEASGIRDGSGKWHGSDPVCGIVLQLRDLEREDENADLEREGVNDDDTPWGVNDDDKPF